MPSYDAYGGHGRAHPESDALARQRADQAARLGEELAAGQTARQRELAGRIYQELRAGAPVEDIQHLIAKLHRTTVEDARDRTAVRRPDGRR